MYDSKGERKKMQQWRCITEGEDTGTDWKDPWLEAMNGISMKPEVDCACEMKQEVESGGWVVYTESAKWTHVGKDFIAEIIERILIKFGFRDIYQNCVRLYYFYRNATLPVFHVSQT